jgi:hypothetical protein
VDRERPSASSFAKEPAQVIDKDMRGQSSRSLTSAPLSISRRQAAADAVMTPRFPPLRARYANAQAGTIVYAGVNPDYTRRPEPSDAFPALDELKARKSAKMSA